MESMVILLLVCSFAWNINSLAIEKIPEDKEIDQAKERESLAVFDQISKHNRAYNDEERRNDRPGLFEGDIKIIDEPEGLASKVPESEISSSYFKRAMRREQNYLWIDRVVPYEVSKDLAGKEDLIKHALDNIQSKSCVSFVKHTTEKNWIKFVAGRSCSSYVGRSFWLDKGQEINLGEGCVNTGTIIHEVLHALGFWHEQSRPDRDKYIEIMWENITPDQQYNFGKYDRQSSDLQGTDYDYASIMHYGSKAFSQTNKYTIKKVSGDVTGLGQRQYLSVNDIIKLNKLYKCEDVGKVYTEWSNWSPCDSKCEKFRQRFCSNYYSAKCPEANFNGVHEESVKCSNEECYQPIDGHWNRWSAWGDCSATCGDGTKRRTRGCTNPAPKYNGKTCSGTSEETATCIIKPCGLNPDDCLFDTQIMCDGLWTATDGDYMWYRNNGPTPSGGTGPESDHTTKDTTKDGHYMFAESSTPAKAGMKAILVSKTFPTVSKRCMTFFYSMHGIGTGALRVFQVSQEGVHQRIKLWEKLGSQGDQWLMAELEFSGSLQYKIEFEAERGSSFQGDIAVDDIYFRDLGCSDPLLVIPQSVAPAVLKINPDQEIDACGVKVKPLGCYKEASGGSKLLEHSLVNSRNSITWKDYAPFLYGLICDCVKKAKAKNLKIIGLQYYGECYGTNSGHYDLEGPTDTCVNKDYMTCTSTNIQEPCIGAESTNYVYKIV